MRYIVYRKFKDISLKNDITFFINPDKISEK
jgi:hypothetical protein